MRRISDSSELADEAFGLTLGECKMAEGWGSTSIRDAAAFDAYFTALIEQRRAEWDL